jgi:hypothetical protein
MDRVPLADRATSGAVWIMYLVLLTKRTMECISPVEMLDFANRLYSITCRAMHYITGRGTTTRIQVLVVEIPV